VEKTDVKRIGERGRKTALFPISRTRPEEGLSKEERNRMQICRTEPEIRSSGETVLEKKREKEEGAV